MRQKIWKHEGVDLDGQVVGGGMINVRKELKVGEGCGLIDCDCSKGLWLSISNGLDNEGIVSGMTFYFDSMDEMIDIIGGHLDSLCTCGGG